MKAKKIFLVALGTVLTGAVLTYSIADLVTEPKSTRTPASVPTNYDALKACEKQEILWQKVLETKHSVLPEVRKMGLLQVLAMAKQEVAVKGRIQSDFAPEGWKKYLHGRGALAKVKIIPRENKYTGIFQGADCGLLRLSLTYQTSKSRPVAPGLALKVLRDGVYSANISALVSLDGQGHDFDFFKHPMSNIVPIGKDFGQKIVHSIFKRASKYPEELLALDLARIDAKGQTLLEVVAPRQMFFVPTLHVASTEHDVREDFLTIPTNTVIYQIHLVKPQHRNFDYTNYKSENVASFLKESEYVADIVTTSEFVASEFGDDGIFFRHELRPKK